LMTGVTSFGAAKHAIENERGNLTQNIRLIPVR
jgi:hypothetical protein